MTWIPLDDGFPDNPKVARAGDLAAWLYVCGLCYAGRNLTDGLIPKNQVPKLTALPKPAALARKLVTEGLWEDPGDSDYVIHDYAKWNKPAEDVKRKREDDRERKKQWRSRGQSGGRDTGQDAGHDTNGNGGHPPGIPRSQSQSPSEVVNQSSSTTGLVASAEDDDVSKAIEAKVDAEYRERITSHVVAKEGPVASEAAWKAGCRRHWRAEVAANGPSVLKTPSSRRNDLPPCPACDSTGWVDTTTGMTPCHACERVHA